MQEELPFDLQSTLAVLDQKRKELAASVLAFNTSTAYELDWKLFTGWCAEYARSARPASADTVSLFVTAQLTRGLKIATARRRLFAITYYHRLAGIELAGRFQASELLRSAQRQRVERPRRSRPLEITELREISDLLGRDGSVAAIRDRAILLVGFSSALRRSSIVALNIDDLEFKSEGVILTVVKEKQDQEARGRYIAIPYGKHETTCAVAALRAWLRVRPETPNREVFVDLSSGRHHGGLTPQHVTKVVKRGIALLGRDPRGYSGHSLRSGFITAAGEEGVSDLLIAEQSGHRNMNVLRMYLRRTNAFRANPCAALDL
jgi:site-specific recombinase XerD